jgi:hypothetical protein
MNRLLSIVVLVFTGCAGSPPEKPPMSLPLQSILKHADAKSASPASEEAIAKVAAHYKKPLPEELLQLWRNTNGVKFNKFEGNLLGPYEVLKYIENPVWFDFASAELLPLYYNDQSDFYVICMGEPLAYRIMFTPHDDGPELKYRNIDSFFEDLLVGLDSNEFSALFFHPRNGDYDRSKKRTAQDQTDALALLTQPEGDHNWNYAIQLLDESDPAPWKKLLETDHFIRRDARAHLSALASKSPRMKELYEQDQLAFAEFFDRFEKAMKEAGLPVGERSGSCLKIGSSWKELEAFFHLRHEPRAMERMVELCQDRQAGRDARLRPDYILKKKSN